MAQSKNHVVAMRKSMASFGNVHVVVLGIVDIEGNLIRVTQGVFESEEHGVRWAEAEREAGHRTLSNEWIAATTEGDFGHIEDLVEDAWLLLEDKSVSLRAKRKLLRVVDRTENTEALERARKILLGEDKTDA